ncbi:MAG: xanthine dehydrogenase molybdopterin binding subunit [Hyphomicrobiales bacterium]
MAVSKAKTGASRLQALAVVGKPLAHESAAMHVRGSAPYIDDLPEPEGTLHVAPGYAREGARGRITRVDLSAVEAYPGVICVLTAADVPGINDCSPSIGGDPVLADGEILFHGQVVFAVVAITREIARRAARLGKVEVEQKRPSVTVEDAIRDRREDVLPEYSFVRKDAAAAIASSANSLIDSFRIGGQEHFYLEGQIALAIPQEAGTMLVHSSTQHPSEVQHCLAKVLAKPEAMVVCECRRMGGGFGGKESQAAQWACLAALAAVKTGKPAKCRLDRDDDMIMTGKRHDFRASYEAGYDADGRLTAVNVELDARCGCSADLSQGVIDRTMFHADNAYYYPALRIHTRRLRTDTVSNTAFRGFGGPQGMLFAERLMESIAMKTGRDALDVRKRNFYGRGRDVTPYGQQVTGSTLVNLVNQLEETSNYRARRERIGIYNSRNGVLRKGLSLAPVKFGISFTLTHLNQAGALVLAYTDGSVQINHGGTEMGQGLYTKVAQVVAEVFGIAMEQVRVTATTTGKVPNTSPTAASSGADLNGMAAKRAAEEVKDNIGNVLAREWKIPKARLVFSNGQVTAGNRAMSFAEACKKTHAARLPLSATGFYATPDITWDRAKAHGSPFFYFAYGAACSEVTIDTMTGEMAVDRVDILHDAGKSLNPVLDLGQVEGAFVQGMGWLTTEELVYDAEGRLRTHAPSTYKIPCASDVPEQFNVALFDSPGNEVDTVFRSKAVGEPPLMLGISVWTAIFNAVASMGERAIPALDAPATPEAILHAVKSVRP